MQSVNGNNLNVLGAAQINFKIGKVKQRHEFFVVNNMNRMVILGRSWLCENGVRLFFDLGCLKIKDTYIPLEQDIHISALVRMNQSVTLKPYTSLVCLVKVKNRPSIPVSECYAIKEINTSYLANEPGVCIAESVAILSKNRRFPVMITNNTAKHVKIDEGRVIGKVEQISPTEVKEISMIDTYNKQTTLPTNVSTEDINAPEEFKTKIVQLINQNKDLFANKDSELTHTSTVKMQIDTGDHPPIKLKPYRTPLNNRKIIDDTIDEMLEANIIRRSRSEWAFPVVIVDKKDGSKRFCVDFRKLNRISKSMQFPLPLIDDILCLLGKAKFFTSLDMKSGYWQILMDEKDREKTSFVCHRGQFSFQVVPFGLKAAPALFSELMSIVLQDLGDYAVNYLDDILIFSENFEDHLKHLNTVFNRLRTHNLKLKLKKCQFLQKEINYLGFQVNQHGVKPDATKVQAIKHLPEPSNVKEARGFIGTCSYYRRFIPNFSDIARPIIELTKKYAKFKWTPDCQEAFDYLKDSLTVVPMLYHPDMSKPFILYTDASDYCVGSVLVQTEVQNNETVERPIYFLSHKLSTVQCRWSTIVKEAYAIYYSLQKLHHYLHNSKFRILCDHKPLKHLLDSPSNNRKVQLWSLSIAGYDCTIEYIPGVKNTVADLLSRKPTTGNDMTDEHISEPDIDDRTYQIGAINSNSFNPKEFTNCKIQEKSNELDVPDLSELNELNMTEEQNKDDKILKLKAQLESGNISEAQQQKYIQLDGILYYISKADTDPVLRLYVPEHLQKEVIKQYHDYCGHFSVNRCFYNISIKYFWPGLYKNLHSYINSCLECQSRNLKVIKAPLQETEIPPYPFAKVGLDLSGPYPTSLSNNKYLVGFIDLFSGWFECFPVPNKNAENIAHLLIDEIIPRFGTPLQIITDNGSENVNKVMRRTLAALNIDHRRTNVERPQSNGLVERVHRTLHDILAKRVAQTPNQWDVYLNQALAAIRFNVNSSTKRSPFYLMYNRDVNLPLDNILKPRRRYHGDEMHEVALEHQHKNFLEVYKNMKTAKRNQTERANRKAKPICFQIGDPVFYKNRRKHSKLDVKFKPFYRIIEQKSPVNYVIKNQLTQETIHAHVEQLRLANLDWQIPKAELGAKTRQAKLVFPYSENESSDSKNSDQELTSNSEPSASKQNSQTKEATLKKLFRKERSNSDSEDDMPLFELRKRLRQQKTDQNSATKNITYNSDVTTNASDYELHNSDNDRSDALKMIDSNVEQPCSGTEFSVTESVLTDNDISGNPDSDKFDSTDMSENEMQIDHVKAKQTITVSSNIDSSSQNECESLSEARHRHRFRTKVLTKRISKTKTGKPKQTTERTQSMKLFLQGLIKLL